MIRKINLMSFNRTPKGIKQTKSREKDRIENATLSIESYYIIRFFEKYLMSNKAFKDLYKNINKENKITTISIFIDSPKNVIFIYKESNYIEYQTVDTYQHIKLLRGNQRADKLLEIISTSANEFEQYIPGVKEVFSEAIESFKQAGYKNIWVHQKKRLKGVGTVKLVCELTMFEFTLDLVVEDKDKEIYKQRLITTMPHNLSWHSLFKTLIVTDKEISVTDRIYEKPFFTVAVKDMLTNKDGKFIFTLKHYEAKSNKGMVSTLKSESFEAFKKCISKPAGIPCPQFD